MTIYSIDQTFPYTVSPFMPFALTDVLTEYAGKEQQSFCHFWQLPDTLILGMKDTRIPYLKEALIEVKKAKFQPVIRNSGGLGVINDTGVLNVSLIFPKDLAAATDTAYELMQTLLQRAFPEQTIAAYEISDSYCPGTFDLSINGKKIAGTAQRRIKEGVAVMMYLSVNGNQQARGQLMRRFYQTGLKSAFGTNGYPAVNPESMTTLSDVFNRDFTIQEVVLRLRRALSQLHNEPLLPIDPEEWLASKTQSDQLAVRLSNMVQRNEPLKEVNDVNPL